MKMKQNKPLRLAAVLLILTLASSSIVSRILAKYAVGTAEQPATGALPMWIMFVLAVLAALLVGFLHEGRRWATCRHEEVH